MRWFVDVSSVGKAADKQSYCVEAESWQRALQAARELRDDPGPMTGFSIELLDNGFSAVDPIKRQRYSIRKAADGTPLTEKGSTRPPESEKAADKSDKASDRTKAEKEKPKKGSSTNPPAVAAKKGSSAPPPSVAPKKGAAGKSTNTLVSASARASDASVAEAKPAPASTPPPADEPSPQSRPPASRATGSSRPPAPDLNLSPKGHKNSAPPRVEVIAPEQPEIAPATGLEILSKREQDAGALGPLTYREYAYFLDGSPSTSEAEQLLRKQLAAIRTSLGDTRPGKLVNLALFNVRFSGRPPKLPVATLTWKDWKTEPVVAFPRAPQTQQAASTSSPPPAAEAPAASPDASSDHSVAAAEMLSTATLRMTPEEVAAGAPSAPPPSMESAAPPHSPTDPAPPLVEPVASIPAPEPEPAPAPEPAPEPEPAPAPEPEPAPPAAEPAQPLSSFPAPATLAPPPTVSSPAVVEAASASEAPVSAPPESQAPATTRGSDGFPPGPASARTGAPKKRLRGDELIADLFEAMHDLQFLRDAIEGSDFCLTLALEKMPARGGIVHLYDINHRQFVIMCVGGVGGEQLLSQRSAENDPILLPTMKRRRALVLADATTSMAAQETARYQALGGATSLMVAPVALGGRFLGAIELLNPVDNVPFTDDDGHALSYIAEQLAGFVGQRGVVLERDPAPTSAPVPAAPKSRRSVRAR